MYCPRCGQQQVSEDTRFCSRCGFLLSNISPILANNGEIPFQLLTANKTRLLTRRYGVIFSIIWLLVFGVLLTAIAAVLLEDTSFGERIIPLFGVIGFIGGFIFFVLSLFLPSSRAAKINNFNQPMPNYSSPNQISGNPNNQTALPPPSAIFTPVNEMNFNQQNPQPVYAPPTNQNWRGAKTGELLQPPPSVTEDTTRILHENK